MSWAFGSAVRKGSVHTEIETCQDFAVCDLLPNGSIAAVLADGAGSAELGAVGARVACVSFLEQLNNLASNGTGIGRSSLLGAFGKTVAAVESQALEMKARSADLSSTLIAGIVSPKDAYFLQIGDGAAVFKSRDAFTVATWPAETEFVNTTHFVTSANAMNLVQVRRVAGRLDELYMFSDGLQYLVLDFKSQSPHQKFFDSVSEQLVSAEPGPSSNFTAWLEALLAAPQVTQRTDDDTSIICAKRLGVS